MNEVACVISLCTDTCETSGYAFKFPEVVGTKKIPVLTICGSVDSTSPPEKHAWKAYSRTQSGTPKLIFEVEGGTHFAANGPGGLQTEKGSEPKNDIYVFGMLLNLCCSASVLIQAEICPGFCFPRKCWFECPCPGDYDTPTGFASKDAPGGAVGGVALTWLQLYLRGDEEARGKLIYKPLIASKWQSEGVVDGLTAPKMEEMAVGDGPGGNKGSQWTATAIGGLVGGLIAEELIQNLE